jgi:polysaccharide export outer membrane protein
MMMMMKTDKNQLISKHLICILLSIVFLNFLSPHLCMSGDQEEKNDYRIGIGDRIFISDWRNENLSANVTVRPDGKISFFLVGDIMVLGLTPMELKDLLTEKLEQFVSDTDVTVIIEKINSMDIYVLGEVKKPGIYNLNKRISLLHLLSLAGGIDKTVDIESAFLLRDGKKINIDFHKLLYEGDLTQNMTLEAYDLLYFPDNSNKNITVYGEINRPGKIPYRKDLSIMDAIVLSGGMNKYANLSKIKIIRGDKTIMVNFQEILDNDKMTANIKMRPDDIVIVPKSLF